jgi:predicted house-cleaning NTP pyrophosphatase (Maf/HAM1 superfamily)
VFPHRFSREGDPQVHVHVLAVNMTLAGDAAKGVEHGWRTLDARDLYRHRMAAGYLFQAELRQRLTDALGVRWTTVHKGAAEIEGVPRPLLAALSQRRAQILSQLGGDGRRGTAREAEIAALTTRKRKETYDLPTQRSHWRAAAEEHDFGPEDFGNTLGRTEFEAPSRAEILVAAESIVDADGVTRERSTFSRRDVVQRLAAEHGRGASVGRIEDLADRVIASDQVVALEPGVAGASVAQARPISSSTEPLLTTAEMLALEAELLDQAAGRLNDGVGVVSLSAGEAFERRPSGLVLSHDQRQMVERLVTSGAGVEVVRAKAGTGKTTAIDVAWLGPRSRAALPTSSVFVEG